VKFENGWLVERSPFNFKRSVIKEEIKSHFLLLKYYFSWLDNHFFHYKIMRLDIIEVASVMQQRDYRKLPLVYSCSGCSSAAQTANYIALKLDRDGEAEMSCISGVGGNVTKLVKIAQSGRPVIALDGCALSCTLNCLDERGVAADYHLQLQEHGVKKRYHADFNQENADEIAVDLVQHARRLCENWTTPENK
jgi:uncharacterized metal-binding protein